MDVLGEKEPVQGTCPRCRREQVELVIMDGRCKCSECWNHEIVKDAPDPKVTQ